MSDDGCLFTFYTLTPLHAGAGDSTGAIDLPVQREKHTKYPVVYSSSVKGSLRCYFEQNDNDKSYVPEIFGKEGDDQKDSSSGNVIFTDAKILFFPVRSSDGVFKWITCPFVIERLKRDLKFIGILKDNISAIENTAFKQYASSIILEDFPITACDCSSSSASLLEFLKILTVLHIAEDVSKPEDVSKAVLILSDRLIIVSDDVFKTLVSTATQIIARNVLKENKTSNNLWYEEAVPADAIFYTIMKPAYKGNDAISKLSGGITERILQIGANETIGYGFVKMSNNIAAELLKTSMEAR